MNTRSICSMQNPSSTTSLSLFSGTMSLGGSRENVTALQKISRLRFTLKMAVAATIALSGGMSLSACSDGKSIPAAPDYQDSTQWYVTNRQAAADVFYIISTETGDYRLPNGEMCHWADTYSDSLRAPLYAEMLGVDTWISGRLNFFSPYYRQCSLQSFQSDSLTAERMPLATDDVRRAFKHYLKHQNGGRPFILAGFSQGAHIMLELLKEMDDHTYQQLIAAYAIGIAIHETAPHIVPAKRADDTGVTICYNSVRDTSCTMRGWERSIMAINPVNWKTDSTRATLITEPSPLLPLAEQKQDTMTVHLERRRGCSSSKDSLPRTMCCRCWALRATITPGDLALSRPASREHGSTRRSISALVTSSSAPDSIEVSHNIRCLIPR